MLLNDTGFLPSSVDQHGHAPKSTSSFVCLTESEASCSEDGYITMGVMLMYSMSVEPSCSTQCFWVGGTLFVTNSSAEDQSGKWPMGMGEDPSIQAVRT